MSGGDKKFSGLAAGFLLGGKTTKATKPRVSPPGHHHELARKLERRACLDCGVLVGVWMRLWFVSLLES